MKFVAPSSGWLFDLYPRGGAMVLWFLTDAGERVRLLDPFAPSFYVDARTGQGGARLRGAVERLEGLEWLGPTQRLDFWSGRPREVLEVRVTDLDRYGPNLRALARRHPEWIYYNCDIPPEIHYGYERRIFPTARCEFTREGDRLVSYRVLDDPHATDYAALPLREAELGAEGALAGRRPRLKSLSLAFEGRTLTWDEGSPEDMLLSLRDCLADLDPDLIWTTGGDSVLLPALLGLAAQCKIDSLGLDRERGIERRLVHDGRTYVSYGRVLYQAPDYPLFGRWHIDRNNSFWTSEAGLDGLIEVSRLSKIPIQRAARRSIGTGISSIQLDEAYRQGYLIPWKKTRPEAWKTAATLLKSDRGGLVYQPLTGVYEDVIELDFVSMYPTIMVRCNVSPETIDCDCCPPSRDVPEIGYTICRRREGLVSRALEPIISRRAEYKRLRKQAEEAGEQEAYERYDGRQNALKWLLVCCFGYLGYRNARFGRIEAHESTCAFSREKLLQASEICERRGFDVLHAIVDCVWVQKRGASGAEIARLCAEINRATDLTIALEGRYRWIAFLPSRQNPDMPVPNRYFGSFGEGKLKYRGIEIRRSDQAPYVQNFQGELLERLAAADSLAACRAMKDELIEMVRRAEQRLRLHEAPLEQLILKRKTSKEAEEYRNNSMTAVAARQAARAGLNLHAGEAVRFLVVDSKNRDPDSRVRLTPLLQPEESYDVEFYVEHVRRAAATVLEPLLGQTLAEMLGLPPEKKGRGNRGEMEEERIYQPEFV